MKKSCVYRILPVFAGMCIVAAAIAFAAAGQKGPRPIAASLEPESDLIDRGRYLMKIAGCNDCHTAGYMAKNGKVPESEWLMGDTLGWKGPWGTTYATNLRLYMATLSEDNWVQVAKSLRTRPPMPWFALHDMEETDLRAIHQFIRTLEPLGAPAPAALPPGVEPAGPYALFPDPPPVEE